MDKEKERQLVLINEEAQLKLKKIINDCILLGISKDTAKMQVINLIMTTSDKLRELEVDESYIVDLDFAFKTTFMLWYEQILIQLKKIENTAKLDVITKTVNEMSGLVIDSEGLKRANVKNIREFMTIYDDAAAGYYYDYAKKIDELIDDLNQHSVMIGKRSIRAVAETKARYDIINEDLKKLQDKGVRYMVATAHANASERCSWWQGKIFILDIDIATREMGQYDGKKPNQTIKGYIDGKPYYSLKEACENGFLSYNCQHRLVEYYKGIHIQNYDLSFVAKKRDITSRQRYLERRIREEKTKVELAVTDDKKKKAKQKAKELTAVYKKFCKDNNVARFDWRTKLTPSELTSIKS